METKKKGEKRNHTRGGKKSHYGKQKENGIRSSVGKLGANKKEDSQKETPRATSKGPKPEVEEGSKERIKFDEDVTNILKFVHSSHENKAEAHPEIIFRVGKDRFGAKEAKQKTQSSGPSKRQKKCKT